MDVGSYRIDSLIAETPLGALYAGLAHSGGLPVLIYRMRPEVGGDARLLPKLQAQARLLREARVPGMPKLLDVGRLPDQTVYAVLSQVTAGSLVSAVARHRQTGTSTDGLAVEIGQRLSRTLARAHAEGVYHLTLTPAQVLVATDDNSDERVYLLGLGLATLLGRTRSAGWAEEHLLYAAPEQRLTDGQVSAATDVYALGVLLGQLLRERADLKALIALMCSPDAAARPSMADVSAQLQATQPTPATVGAGLAEAKRPLAKPASYRPRLAVADAKASGAAAAGHIESGAAGPVRLLSMGEDDDALTHPDERTGDRAAPGANSPADGERIGALFGNFRVVRKLGEGGMGVVYEAEHTKIGRRAAVKILHGRYAENDAYARRFLNEARAVNIVRHPGLVEIFEFGKLPDGTLYYIMEYLAGEGLDHRIASRQAPFSEKEAINIALQTARALSAAHEKGIVHRDLKPGNIMFLPDPVNPGLDWVKVLDFGIAKVRAPGSGAANDLEKTAEDTGQGVRLGTPLYMAPEQHGGAEDVDGRADVFSLGVVLYEMLAGQAPFRNNSLSLLLAKPTPIEKLNAQVQSRLAELIRRMMAIEADERPTMRQVEEGLDALLASSAKRWNRRTRVGVFVAALSGVALLLALLYSQLWRAKTPAELHAEALAALQSVLAGSDTSLQVLAATAIGQSHDLDARALLRPLLAQSQRPLSVREAAVRALAELGDSESQPQLVQILDREPQQGMLTVTVAAALAQLQHPRGLEALRSALAGTDDLSRVQAALALLERGDFSGSELLWARIGRGASASRGLTGVLGRLALSGDERARARLSEEFAELAAGEARTYIAYTLARLGDGSARAYLRKLTAGDGSEPAAMAVVESGAQDKRADISDRLLAERLLSALGDARGEGPGLSRHTLWLLSMARDVHQPDARRELALATLGDSGQVSVLVPLGEVLRQRGASPRLQVAAAGAILSLLAGEPARLAEQSLSWARSALGSESVAARELAVLALGDMDGPATIAQLGEALRDREGRIRRQAALQLARKDVLPALRELRTALSDSDREVRLAGVEAIGQLLVTLRQRRNAASVGADSTAAGSGQDGDAAVTAQLRDWLKQKGDQGSELDRVLRSGLLFQLGDDSRRAVLQAGLSAKDPLLRKLAIGFLVGTGDDAAIEKALADPDRAVRLAAALHLAEKGHQGAMLALRGFVAAGDADGLTAYSALRRLHQASEPPPDLANLLTTGDLLTRYAVVDVLRELGPATALPLLHKASVDRASVVRRRVLAVAAEFFRSGREPGFAELIFALRSDSDIIVRAFAAQLIAEFDMAKKRRGSTAGPSDGTTNRTGSAAAGDAAGPANAVGKVAATASADAGLVSDGGTAVKVNSITGSATALAAGPGQVMLEGEELVRVQIDRQAAQLLSEKPISLASGKHVLRYLGGQQEFSLSPGQTLRLRVPVRLTDQLLVDGRDALNRKDLGRAQEQLERLRRTLQRGARGPVPPALQADVAFELARLYEARSQLREALAEYNRCLAVPAAQRRPELNATLTATLSRLAGRAGRIQIYTVLGGRCTMTQELLLPPGEQIVSIGKGQTRTVFSQIGSTNKLMACP